MTRNFSRLALLLAALLPAMAFAQTREKGPWWPNAQWGAGDAAGGSNWITPEKVLQAVALVKTGRIRELGHVYERGMPLNGSRSYNIFIPSFPTHGPILERGVVFNDEYVAAEIGQVGTQFDGFAHQTHRNSHYNCFKTEEIAGRGLFTKLGIQNTGAFITRGVLIDVAGFKGVEMLGDNYEVTVDDLEGALKKQNMTLRAGDAVIVHTGWGKIYGKENARYVKSCPGLGVKAAQWIIDKNPILLGADNWPVEVAPNPDPQLSLPVHQLALVVNGVHLLENLKLDDLVQKQAYEFAFMMQPLKIQGGTGSTVSPIAVR
jgi:kynurenine formamidase